MGKPAAKTLEVDATTLKVLAHPMRVKMLRILQLRERASVTSLAEELGETTGATSYHLRQLARHGIVEESEAPREDGERGAGRKQRFWQMAVDELHVSGFSFMADSDTREAASFLLRETVAERSRRLANWYTTATTWPETWQRASSDRDGVIDLDPKQTRALADEIHVVLDRYRDMKPGRGARKVEIQFAVFPVDAGGSK